MPLIFCIWIGMVILAFVVWKKADIGTQIKKNLAAYSMHDYLGLFVLSPC